MHPISKSQVITKYLYNSIETVISDEMRACLKNLQCFCFLMRDGNPLLLVDKATTGLSSDHTTTNTQPNQKTHKHMCG